MSRSIALLLQGNHADLFASLRALELARRTRGEVHAVVVEPAALAAGGQTGQGGRDLLKLATWLGEEEGIKVHSHYLPEGEADRSIIEFLISHRIVCLVIGARDRAAERKLCQWTARLRENLMKEDRWYFRSFWPLVTEPWDEKTFEKVLSRLEEGWTHNSGADRYGPDQTHI